MRAASERSRSIISRLREPAERLRARVGQLAHHEQAVRVGDRPVAPRRVERLEVALGRVDDVAHDVGVVQPSHGRRDVPVVGRRASASIPSVSSRTTRRMVSLPSYVMAFHSLMAGPSWCAAGCGAYSSSWRPAKYISGSLSSSIWMPSGSLKYIDSSMPRSGPAYFTPSASSRSRSRSQRSRGTEMAMCWTPPIASMPGLEPEPGEVEEAEQGLVARGRRRSATTRGSRGSRRARRAGSRAGLGRTGWSARRRSRSARRGGCRARGCRPLGGRQQVLAPQLLAPRLQLDQLGVRRHPGTALLDGPRRHPVAIEVMAPLSLAGPARTRGGRAYGDEDGGRKRTLASICSSSPWSKSPVGSSGTASTT